MTSGTDGYHEHVEKYIKLAKSSFRFFHKMLQKKQMNFLTNLKLKVFIQLDRKIQSQ